MMVPARESSSHVPLGVSGYRQLCRANAVSNGGSIDAKPSSSSTCAAPSSSAGWNARYVPLPLSEDSWRFRSFAAPRAHGDVAVAGRDACIVRLRALERAERAEYAVTTSSSNGGAARPCRAEQPRGRRRHVLNLTPRCRRRRRGCARRPWRPARARNSPRTSPSPSTSARGSCAARAVCRPRSRTRTPPPPGASTQRVDARGGGGERGGGRGRGGRISASEATTALAERVPRLRQARRVIARRIIRLNIARAEIRVCPSLDRSSTQGTHAKIRAEFCFPNAGVVEPVMAPAANAPAGVTYVTGAATRRTSARCQRGAQRRRRTAGRWPRAGASGTDCAIWSFWTSSTRAARTTRGPRSRVSSRAPIQAWARGRTVPRRIAGQTRLDAFVVPPSSLADAKAGTCVRAQASLAALVAGDDAADGLLRVFEHRVGVLVESCPASRNDSPRAARRDAKAVCTFYAQTPPTLRLQPGPSSTRACARTETPSTATRMARSTSGFR